MRTIYDEDFLIQPTDKNFNYQSTLTTRLDSLTDEMDQRIINEIVLWKVNRYALLGDESLDLLNQINPNSIELDNELTERLLRVLLRTKGIQLAMASTILKFRNRKIYQIIDQRVYRILYGEELKLRIHQNQKNVETQITTYFAYLRKLREACGKLSIEFEFGDRILFEADKRINKSLRLKNY